MARAVAIVSGTLASFPPFARLTAYLKAFAEAMFDPYRPELHYMRGPGPAWRKKHGQVR